MGKRKVNIFTKLMCLILTTLMVLSVFITVIFAADIKYTDENGKTVKLSDFRDTKGHWAQSTILKWADYNMIVGHQGNFMPNQPMKRADVAVVLDRMMGLKTMSYNFFNDLSNDAYYRDALLRNVAAGYFSGTGDNKINPLGNTTREEIAVILCRVFKIDTSVKGKTHFADDYKIAYWARPSIYALSKLGYMNGNGKNVNPKANVTRAEIIQLFDNIAEVYIPSRDTTNQGSNFSLTANRNFVTSRNVDLVRSNIGRDLILTQAARSINLSYTTVKGRIVVLGNTTIDLSNSDVGSIEIYGKSTVNGVSGNVKKVYIGEYGTESTLDTIPDTLVLEPGVRVKIEGIMYENMTTRNKIYSGLAIKADIAAEQGFVMGGPKISGSKVLHTYDNEVTFKDVKITLGETKISEIGVIYTNDVEVVPSLSNYDKRIKYNGSYSAPFDINIGKIYGERAYRVYAIDESGLISYSQPVTLKAYNFDIELELFDINYPETIRAEVLFTGYNIPEISSVKVMHNTTSLYEEEIMVVSLNRAEVGETDKNKIVDTVVRYVGTIKTNSNGTDPITGDKLYEPPTEFGYIITFKDGSVVKKFPVLTNAAPKDIAPVDTITTGIARFTNNNRLEVKNNYIRTRHVQIQEAGVIYREVQVGTPIREPEVGTSGWVTQSSYVNVGLKDTAYFSANLPIKSVDSETHFAAYIKTSNGYYYGNVKKVQNNWVGSESGPKITGEPEVVVLNENISVVNIPVSIRGSIDYDKIGSIVSFTDKDGKVLNYYDGMDLRSADAYQGVTGKSITLVFDKLEKNNKYDVVLQLFDKTGEPSNVISFVIDTSNMVEFKLTNRRETTSRLTFDFDVYGIQSYKTYLEYESASVLNSDAVAYIDMSTSPWGLVVRNAPLQEFTVNVNFRYYISRSVGAVKSIEFDRTFNIHN